MLIDSMANIGSANDSQNKYYTLFARPFLHNLSC